MGVAIADTFGDLDEYPPEPLDDYTPEEPTRTPYRFATGGSFILDAAERPSITWGRGDEVLAAEGEATMIAGGQGTGKTTLAQQFALGRCGFAEYSELLGYPITPGRRRVLYLAMDRPRQIARSFRRMVGDSWRDELDERLSVWPGPPPHDLARVPALLAALCRDADADTVVVDSLKDAALGLSEDTPGSGWNRARQGALVDGVEVIELHHNRKVPNGSTRGRFTLDDIYGSTWLTSGAGSVILLTGAPGDPVVSLHHLKQPLAEVGPLKLIHDHDEGRSSIFTATDLLAVVRASGTITALEAAEVLADTDRPSAADKEKARRKLDRYAREGHLRVIDPGDKTTNRPKAWGPA